MCNKLFWEGVSGDMCPAFFGENCIGVGQTEKEAKVLEAEYQQNENREIDSFSYNRALAELSMFAVTEKTIIGRWPTVSVDKLISYCFHRRLNA